VRWPGPLRLRLTLPECALERVCHEASDASPLKTRSTSLSKPLRSPSAEHGHSSLRFRLSRRPTTGAARGPLAAPACSSKHRMTWLLSRSEGTRSALRREVRQACGEDAGSARHELAQQRSAPCLGKKPSVGEMRRSIILHSRM
jgi:hypothetical protein